MNRRTLLITVALSGAMALSTLTGCFGRQPMGGTQAAYRQVDAEEARELMDTEGDYAIVDARTQSEYDEGHIPGAVLIPHDSVAQLAEDELPDKDQLILVYCRSGNRSKQAAGALAELGYTNVVEFGGINSWPYEVER